MRDLDNLLSRSRKGDKMQTTASIGSVVNFDKIRSNYGLESGEGNEIYNFYNDLESSSDVSAQGTMDILSDEAYPEFRDLVEDLNNTVDDTMEDKVSQLLLVADVLSRLKREGILDQLYDEEIIDEDERKAISSHKILDDIAQDMLSLGSVSILQNRMIDDMAGVFGKLRDNLNTPEVRHGRASHEVVDELVSAGIIDRSRDTKLRSRGNQDETDYRFGSGDRSRDEIRDDRDRDRRSSSGSRLNISSSRGERTGRYNTRPRKKLRLDDRDSRDRRDSYDRGRREERIEDDRYRRDDRYDDRDRRDDSFRRDSRERGLDLGRSSKREPSRSRDDRDRDRRYDDREERGLLSSRTMRRDDRDYDRDRDRRYDDDYDRRNSRSGSRYDRFERASRRDRRDSRGRGKRDDDNVVYEFHPTS